VVSQDMVNAGFPATLGAWLSHLEGLHPLGQAGIELGLERVARVKEQLGQTQHCPVVLVGGTNGKGSTCVYLEGMCRQAGYRVGCYTSPHLIAYNERVRVDGIAVDDAALCAAFACVEEARRAAGDVALTYFEFGTLAAWEVFAGASVEVAILEVGLGGRLDAVNVYEPDVAIVTSVALDHMAWLGDTREAIGREKAGIFRARRPALCADPQPPASLLAHAAAMGADLRLLGRDFGCQPDSEDRLQWRYWSRHGEQMTRRSFAFPGLRGQTQLRNAAVALAALDALGERLHVPMQARREGLILAELPGRFQVLPGRPAIVLDVGHNPQAIGVLVDNLGSMGFFDHTRAVVGMLADKDIVASLEPLRGKVDHWYLANLSGPRGATAERLAEAVAAARLGGEVSCHASPTVALAAAQEGIADNDRIVVLGSFYTVAEALLALGRA
jgi:dihydrofolate synthase / folylpolyglutamate synthase